jgi:hypothetical protein
VKPARWILVALLLSARVSGGVGAPGDGSAPACGGGDGSAGVGGGVPGRVAGEDVRARRAARPPAAGGGDAGRVRTESDCNDKYLSRKNRQMASDH